MKENFVNQRVIMMGILNVTKVTGQHQRVITMGILNVTKVNGQHQSVITMGILNMTKVNGQQRGMTGHIFRLILIAAPDDGAHLQANSLQLLRTGFSGGHHLPYSSHCCI